MSQSKLQADVAKRALEMGNLLTIEGKKRQTVADLLATGVLWATSLRALSKIVAQPPASAMFSEMADKSRSFIAACICRLEDDYDENV